MSTGLHFFRPPYRPPLMPSQRSLPYTEPGSKVMVVDPGHLTLTGRNIAAFYTGFLKGTLTLTGRSIDMTRTMAVSPGHLTLTGRNVLALVTYIMPVTPGHLTLIPRAITLSSLTPSGARRPLLIRKTAEAPATYWRGTINNG